MTFNFDKNSAGVSLCINTALAKVGENKSTGWSYIESVNADAYLALFQSAYSSIASRRDWACLLEQEVLQAEIRQDKRYRDGDYKFSYKLPKDIIRISSLRSANPNNFFSHDLPYMQEDAEYIIIRGKETLYAFHGSPISTEDLDKKYKLYFDKVILGYYKFKDPTYINNYALKEAIIIQTAINLSALHSVHPELRYAFQGELNTHLASAYSAENKTKNKYSLNNPKKFAINNLFRY